ncbi:GATA zinc finger domain-containing protein 11 [Lucilia sericata]|uniref:GATA zinc finger domain-containing protein 11 n=1 Tax=Lucilia sericata TaxID=13632 RepID=UPI0018A86ADD|nr:GATA zinc finger domain-containing protein 11 [Lucilia sericata]
MPLSLTTRRRQQTSSSTAKWSSSSTAQQHLVAQHFSATNNSNNLLRQHFQNQPVRKQKSFIETSHLNKSLLTSHTGRAYLSRGLSVGRSHDIQRSAYPKQVLKKHSSITAAVGNGRNDRDTLKTGDLIKRNITSCGQSVVGGSDFLRNSRRVQAWSSTSSILKSLDKELAQLNGVVGKCKDVKILKGRGDSINNVKINNNAKTETAITNNSHNSHSNKRSNKPEVNKVNLSIVLSHALNSTKEENGCIYSDLEADEDNDETDSDETLSDSNKNIDSQTKDNKKFENSGNTRPYLPAQQRRAVYHSSRLVTNLALSSHSNNNNSTTGTTTTTLTSGLQNPQNFNASPSLTVQRRPPLVRAMSAPVRSFDETTAKSSATFLASKRKSRRRKLNSRNISCDKGSTDVLSAKDLNFEGKPSINRKVLTRSKSVAPDVITLVSLISSEGSDSEKEESSITPTNSHKGSPTRRPPSLRKTGKSVSFQENYPPTFQFASKEYSHMLRRGSIAPLAQRIKSNRPPTAPPGSIFHNNNSKLNNEMPAHNSKSTEEKENNMESLKPNVSPTLNDKPLEEEYEFPEYVRSLKERECWKLYMKMSTKGVNITYDTILRGMLTPTEFRQLQKQRELEEAKALKEAEENGVVEEKSKNSSTAIDRLKESLLKN